MMLQYFRKQARLFLLAAVACAGGIFCTTAAAVNVGGNYIYNFKNLTNYSYTVEPITIVYRQSGSRTWYTGPLANISPNGGIASSTHNLKDYDSTNIKATLNVNTDDSLCVRGSAIGFADAQSKPCSTYVEIESGTRTAYFIVEYNIPPECPATTISWGVGNYCSSTTVTTADGNILALTNSDGGATGNAVAICTNSTWSIQGGSS